MRFRTRKETKLAVSVTRYASNGKQWLTNAVILVLLAISSVIADAQAGAVISGQVVSLQGLPQPYAKVRICPQTASGIPCTPLASIFSDPGLTVPTSNPVSANQYGFYSIFVGSNTSFYQVQTTYGTTTYPFWANGAFGGSTLCALVGGAYPISCGGTGETTAAGAAASIVNGNPIAPSSVTTASITLNGGSSLTGNQGNGALAQHSTGSTFTNDCAKFDVNGNVVDAGAACSSGSGSGTVSTASNYAAYAAGSASGTTAYAQNCRYDVTGNNYTCPGTISAPQHCIGTSCTNLWPLSTAPNSVIYGSALGAAIGGNIAANAQVFTDGTSFYSAAPAYGAYDFAADAWYAFHGAPQLFLPATIKSSIDKFVAAASGGNLPIALTNTGAAYVFYSGCQSDHTTPTLDGAFFVPMMSRLYYATTGSIADFATNAAAMKTALGNVPLNGSTHLVTISASHPYVTWGFQDGIVKTGDDLMGSLLMWKAATDMAVLYTANGDSTNAATMTTYATNIAASLTTSSSLWDSTDGMFYAATGQNNQIDVLGSAYAVYLGFISTAQQIAISTYLNAHYSTLVINGYVHQSPANWAYSAGGNQCGRGTGNYDDGEWSVGNEWVYYALRVNSQTQAQQLVLDFLANADPTKEYYGATLNGATSNLESPMGTGSIVAANYPGALALPVPTTAIPKSNYVNLCAVVTLSTGVTCTSANGALQIASGTTSFTVSGIPGSYVTLVIIVNERGLSGAANLLAEYNGDSTLAHYNYQQGNMPATGSQGGATYAGYYGAEPFVAAVGDASNGSSFTITIPFYGVAGLAKVATGTGGIQSGAIAASAQFTEFWSSTAVITSITFSLNSGNFGFGFMSIYAMN